MKSVQTSTRRNLSEKPYLRRWPELGLAGCFSNSIIISLFSSESPVVVFPRAEASLEVLVAHLGRISLTNQRMRGWDLADIPADAAQAVLRIRCLFRTPGIRNRLFPDPGSQTHIFESLVTIFGGKKFYNSLKIGPNFFFLQHLKKLK
jgi:hypothetical protein